MFLKPLITSPRIESASIRTNNGGDATACETHNVLYTAGPEGLIIGRSCMIATGARFLLPPLGLPDAIRGPLRPPGHQRSTDILFVPDTTGRDLEETEHADTRHQRFTRDEREPVGAVR